MAGRGGAADLLAGLALSFGGVSYDRSPIGHGVSGDVIGDSAVRAHHLASLSSFISDKRTRHTSSATINSHTRVHVRRASCLG